MRDAAGRLLSFIGVQSDVTELTLRRQAEKELQEAKAAAETAAEAKSMFLANVREGRGKRAGRGRAGQGGRCLFRAGQGKKDAACSVTRAC